MTVKVCAFLSKVFGSMADFFSNVPTKFSAKVQYLRECCIPWKRMVKLCISKVYSVHKRQKDESSVVYLKQFIKHEVENAPFTMLLYLFIAGSLLITAAMIGLLIKFGWFGLLCDILIAQWVLALPKTAKKILAAFKETK